MSLTDANELRDIATHQWETSLTIEASISSLTRPSPTNYEDRIAQVHAQRMEVCQQAISWIGTPYFWLSDKKGIGIDCAMLLVRCFVDAGVVEPFDPRPYAANWHVHNAEERYLAWLEKFAVEKNDDTLIPGDVLVWKFGRCFSHSGIFLGGENIVHAYVPNGVCARGRLSDTQLAARPRKTFDVWKKVA